MAIDVEELILAARDMLTELPESVVFSRDNLLGLVKPAISLWQDQTNENPQKRQNFIVESAAVVVAAGVCDLAAEIDSKGFRLEFIKENDIALTITGGITQAPDLMVKFVNSLNRLKMKGRQDRFFTLAYLSGTLITFKQAGSTAVDEIAGTLKLRSPVIPSDLSTMNKAVMYELAILVADLAKQQFRQQNRGLDKPVT